MGISDQFRRVDTSRPLRAADIRVVLVGDDYPDTSYLDQGELEAYRAGAFEFVGVYAKATVPIRGVLQAFRSGGVYGIEHWSNAATEAYLQEVAGEEVSALRDILGAVGVIVEGDDPDRFDFAHQ